MLVRQALPVKTAIVCMATYWPSTVQCTGARVCVRVGTWTSRTTSPTLRGQSATAPPCLPGRARKVNNLSLSPIRYVCESVRKSISRVRIASAGSPPVYIWRTGTPRGGIVIYPFPQQAGRRDPRYRPPPSPPRHPLQVQSSQYIAVRPSIR